MSGKYWKNYSILSSNDPDTGCKMSEIEEKFDEIWYENWLFRRLKLPQIWMIELLFEDTINAPYIYYK